MTFWRTAGLKHYDFDASSSWAKSYIQYSSIAARVVRKALKPEARADALKRGESGIKFTPWKDGKPVTQSS